MRIVSFICLLFLLTAAVASQDQAADNIFRGSVPEELLRPRRGETPHYPIDTVIGEMGQGAASDAAYSFANSIMAGFSSGEIEHPNLSGIDINLRENYLSVLENIGPASYRLGGGRTEPDGAVSFLIRFLGRDMGITGELFVRYVTRRIDETVTKQAEEGGEVKDIEEVITRTTGSWTFEELILEEAKSREEEYRESLQRFDFSPYERFF
jgi:hypothetical protein